MTRPTRRSSVWLAYAAFVLIGVYAGGGGVLLPAQIRDYGVDRATIGIGFFTFSAGFMLAGATAGTLVHRAGTRAALTAAGGAVALTAFAIAARPPFPAYLALQVVLGAGIGVLESVLNAHLSDLPAATALLNRLHAFFGVGALLGPALAAWLLRALPWTAGFLALGLACLPLVVGFLRTFPAGAPAHPPADQRPGGAAGGGLLRTAGRQPAVLLGAVFLAVYVGLEIGVGNWAFSFLVERYRQPEVLAGYTVSGYWLGLTVGRFVINPLATRLGLTPAGTTLGCLAGATACAALTWLAPGAAVAGAGLVLLGFFLGPVFPTAMALVPRLTTALLVPTAIGIMNGVSVLGGAVFPWLAGTITQGVGMWTLPPFAIALGLLQLEIWRRLVRRLTPERSGLSRPG